jgi:ABC-type nitrate/sulfonate/bicarbonate transport system substrate-binding protein
VRLQAFLEARVAAAMLTPPASDKALAAGGVLLADADRYVPGWPLTCGWTHRRWLNEHRSLVVRFIRAWAAATDWLLAPEHRDEAIQLMTDGEQLSRAAALSAYGKVVPRARINPQALQTVIDLRREMGVYKPPYDPPAAFYDDSFWRDAVGDLE